MTPPGFTGSRLDRQDALRTDPAAIALLAARPDARLIALTDYVPEVDDAGRVGWRTLPALPGPIAFLGLLEGAPRFVAIPSPAAPARRTPDLWPLLERMRGEDAAVYAAARSLADWHARHAFCPACGGRTEPIRAGWARRCTACGTDHFPRTDPVVIMLAEHRRGGERRVLVGRQPAFPPHRYSALAGFVEVGESLEEAVARELAEEAGVVATSVRYLSSQPWPFASSLMLACIAEVADDRLTVDHTELEDAMWVSPAEVRSALDGAADARFVAPPRFAIAHTLFERWLAEAQGGREEGAG